MKRVPRFLTMAVVIGMIAVLPASAQVIPGAADDNNMSLLIPINRLELTEDQMIGLHDILSGFLETRDGMDSLVPELEKGMIEFSGTGEELDELLATFREDQIVQMEALRESVASTLDGVRDLLSINQGIVLREELPGLLELGQGREMEAGSRRVQGVSSGMGQRMSANSMGRVGMMTVRVGSQLRGASDRFSGESCEPGMLQSSDQNSYWHEIQSSMMASRSGNRLMMHETQPNQRLDLTSSMIQSRAERELMLSTLQNRSSNDLPEMMQQRLGRVSEDGNFGAMREQIQSRLEQFGEQVPDEFRARLGESMAGLAERLGQQMSGRLEMEDKTPMMREQFSAGFQQADHERLFDLLEQVVEVLELKLEALE